MEDVSVDFAEIAPRVGLLLMEKWILEIRLARLLEAQRQLDEVADSNRTNGVANTTEIRDALAR